MKFSVLFFFTALVFAGTNTLPEITETVRTKAVMENLRQALVGDLVPRDSAGVVCSGCASLGTASLKWGGIFLDYENSGAVRTYAKGLNYQSSGALSDTITSIGYSNRILLPTSGTITNDKQRPVLIHLNCKNGSSSNSFEIDNGNRVIWARLGRLVGTTETYLSTFVMRYKDTENTAQSNKYFFTSDISYLDANPPTTAYNYFLDFAGPTIGTSTNYTRNFCFEMVYL